MMKFEKPIKIWGVKLKDKQKLIQSQSGGAFTAIAENFLNNGAVVYGCGLNSELDAVYFRITDVNELIKIKGSKYVQARLDDTFINIKQDLEQGKIVLFSGTPCYVAAVKQFVNGKKYEESLYTVDFVCHGVPSPLVYKTYLKEKGKLTNSNVIEYVFRDKLSGGWRKHIEKILYGNGKTEICDDYTKLFYTNLSLRPSCGKCHFTRIDRISDFTIGDFWGIQNTYPEFYDDKGVSLMFCNNQRAISVFDEITNNFDTIESEISSVIVMQPNLKSPSKIPIVRKLFWRDFYKYGVLYCSKKWPVIINMPVFIKQKIKKYVKR